MVATGTSVCQSWFGLEAMLSPSSSFIAMMPERRTSTKSESLLRRTVPRVVANMTSRLAQVVSSSGSGITVLMRSP